MNKFMVLYHSPLSVADQMAASTPEQRDAAMAEWMVWSKSCGEAVVDMGMPLQPATSLTSSGSSDSASTAAGFSMMQGESAEEVTKMMQGHPHLKMPGSSIEVLEVLSAPGM